MPAPRKYPEELRERAKRMVAEAREQDPSLSLHAAVTRIGPRVGVQPDTLRTWCRQAEVDFRDMVNAGIASIASIASIDTLSTSGQDLDRPLQTYRNLARRASPQYTGGLWTLMAWIHWRTGNREDARPALHLAKKLDPDINAAHYLTVFMHEWADPQPVPPVTTRDDRKLRKATKRGGYGVASTKANPVGETPLPTHLPLRAAYHNWSSRGTE